MSIALLVEASDKLIAAIDRANEEYDTRRVRHYRTTQKSLSEKPSPSTEPPSPCIRAS